MDLLGWVDILSLHIPTTMALAAVALIGYIFGQRTRRELPVDIEQARRELKRAHMVARELEKIADSVRKDLAVHRGSVSRFKERVRALSENRDDAAWQDLCKEAEGMLRPTLKLAMQISLAYDEIRQQSTQLMTFTEIRTDPLTGVSNRRALDETLDNMFAMMSRYDHHFSLAILDIDHFKQVNDRQGHLHGDRILQEFARLLDESVRDTDLVARYGGEEFVVVMPNTSLEGASIFSERLRELVQQRLPLTISAGLGRASKGDSAQTLLSRADSALYSAKAAGRNRVFRHDGIEIEAVTPEAPSESEREVLPNACSEVESETGCALRHNPSSSSKSTQPVQFSVAQMTDATANCSVD
jgi:diguanylate cyclase (GGDEF)-like protein